MGLDLAYSINKLIMIMIKYFISMFIGFVLIISCASKDEKLQSYKNYVQEISDSLKFENGFNTIKVLGERRSRFRSYFVNDELVFINEDLNIGKRGTSANKYFFKDGELVHFKEHSILMKDDSLNIKNKSIINSTLYLNGEEILESDRMITGVPTPFSKEEVTAIVKHSKILQELAQKNRPKEK